MKCKACGNETNKETTKIIITFSISSPKKVDIQVENKYERLSIEWILNNKQALHKLLDKSLDEISVRLFEINVKSNKIKRR